VQVVGEAASGEEAVGLVRGLAPQVVFMDQLGISTQEVEAMLEGIYKKFCSDHRPKRPGPVTERPSGIT